MLSRRTALVLVGGLLGYLDGKPVAGQSRGLALPLDTVDAIVVTYRGTKVTITPQELMEALAPAQGVVVSPAAQQLYRGK